MKSSNNMAIDIASLEDSKTVTIQEDMVTSARTTQRALLQANQMSTPKTSEIKEINFHLQLKTENVNNQTPEKSRNSNSIIKVQNQLENSQEEVQNSENSYQRNSPSPRKSNFSLQNQPSLPSPSQLSQKNEEAIHNKQQKLTSPIFALINQQTVLESTDDQASVVVQDMAKYLEMTVVGHLKQKEKMAQDLKKENAHLAQVLNKNLVNKYQTKKATLDYGMKDEERAVSVIQNCINTQMKKKKQKIIQQSFKIAKTKGGIEMRRPSRKKLQSTKQLSINLDEYYGEKQETQPNQKKVIFETQTKEDEVDAKLALQMKVSEEFKLQFAQEQLMKKIKTELKKVGEDNRQKLKAHKTAEKMLKQNILETRAQKNIVNKFCFTICQSKAFKIFIPVCIVANTLILGMDKYPIDAQTELFIEFFNLIFYLIFFIEMVLKLFAYGGKMYFMDKANSFDFFIVVVSGIDLVFFFSNVSVIGGEAIQALRVFRLLRVFKLAKIWKSFNYILVTVGNTLQKVSSFSVLLYLFLFTFTILGMDLFAYKVRFGPNGEALDTSKQIEVPVTVPASTFDNFLEASLSVFIVVANDGWSTIYFDHYRSIGPATSTLFFIPLLIIGQHILFQLFLAILLQEFDERSLLQQEMESQKTKPKKSLFDKLCKCCKKKKPRDEPYKQKAIDPKSLFRTKLGLGNNTNQIEAQQGGSVSNALYKENKSLCLFSEENCIRQFLLKLIKPADDFLMDLEKMNAEKEEEDEIQDKNNETKKQLTCMERAERSNLFDNIILIMIIISSILLSLENPLNDPDGELQHVLNILDMVFTGLFTIEVIMKSIAFGFLFNGKNSYLRNAWNFIDFFIVVTSVISLSTNWEFGVIRIIRMVRLLRPLRVIAKDEGLKISIQALFSSLPQITNLIVIVTLFMFIFGIIGVNLLKGMFFYCQTDQVLFIGDTQLESIDGKIDCLNNGGEWLRYHTHFDNIGSSMMQMFTMSQTVGWAAIMYRAMDSRGTEMVPGFHTKPYYSIFFVIYIIIGAFFITNLFVGVMISSYNRESERLGKNFLLSNDQKQWIETKLLVIKIKPKMSIQQPPTQFRQFFYRIVMHPKFEYFILMVILLNTVVLALKHAGMSEEFKNTTDLINEVFTFVFLLETIFKLIGMGKQYFRDGWNVFDFLIVLGSLVFFLIGLINPGVNFGSSTQVIRACRIGRVLKLFRGLKSLKIIFATFIKTLPALINVGGLMLLLIYIYAVLGVDLFATVMDNGPMHRYLNFRSVPIAALTLFRIATGENWNDLLNAVSQQFSITFQCIENPTYEDYVNADMNTVGCGKEVTAVVFFSSYILLISMIFLNLFIAIILDGYFQTMQNSNQSINDDMLEKFKEAWAKFDPEATGYLMVKDFTKFMFALEKPLGWDKSYKTKPYKRGQFMKHVAKEMQTYKNNKFLFFNEVIDQLSLYYIIGQEVKQQMADQGYEFEEDESILSDVIEDDHSGSIEEDHEDYFGNNSKSSSSNSNSESNSDSDSGSSNSSSSSSSREDCKNQKIEILDADQKLSKSHKDDKAQKSIKREKRNSIFIENFNNRRQSMLNAENNKDVFLVKNLAQNSKGKKRTGQVNALQALNSLEELEQQMPPSTSLQKQKTKKEDFDHIWGMQDDVKSQTVDQVEQQQEKASEQQSSSLNNKQLPPYSVSQRQVDRNGMRLDQLPSGSRILEEDKESDSEEGDDQSKQQNLNSSSCQNTSNSASGSISVSETEQQSNQEQQNHLAVDRAKQQQKQDNSKSALDKQPQIIVSQHHSSGLSIKLPTPKRQQSSDLAQNIEKQKSLLRIQYKSSMSDVEKEHNGEINENDIQEMTVDQMADMAFDNNKNKN